MRVVERVVHAGHTARDPKECSLCALDTVQGRWRERVAGSIAFMLECGLQTIATRVAITAHTVSGGEGGAMR